MKSIYLIYTYDLIGQVLKAYEELKYDSIKVVDKNGKLEYHCTDLTQGHTEILSDTRYYQVKEKKEGYNYNDKFLPYFADVTEDVSHSFNPTTFKNCQLMCERRGLNLQFFDHNTQQVKLIAMNSNIYEPVKELNNL